MEQKSLGSIMVLNHNVKEEYMQVIFDKLVTIEIDLTKSQYDIALSIATRLNQENILKEQRVQELINVTLKILISEYSENPRSVVDYFIKRTH
jgi:hypothetical protein